MGADTAWWRRPSTFLAIAGNLVPLAGVLFFGWKLLAVMLAFWLDNVALGLFAAGRILLARLDGKAASGRSSAVTRVYTAGDFALQYGFVCLVHGLLVIGLFGVVAQKPATGDLAEVGVFVLDLLRQQETIIAAAAALLARGGDFVAAYLWPRAYEQADIGREQSAPYRRSFVLHLGVVLGGAVALALQAPTAALVVLVLAKTVGDLVSVRPRE